MMVRKTKPNELECLGVQTLCVDQIVFDPEIVVRSKETNADHVKQIAKHLKSGGTVPDIRVVVDDVGVHRVTDGRHRLLAIKRCKGKETQAVVFRGSREDAIADAARPHNGAHGLRENRKDRRTRAELMIVQFPHWTDRRLATHLGMSHTTVGSYRQDLEARSRVASQATREALDGRSMAASAASTGQIGQCSQPISLAVEPAEPPVDAALVDESTVPIAPVFSDRDSPSSEDDSLQVQYHNAEEIDPIIAAPMPKWNPCLQASLDRQRRKQIEQSFFVMPASEPSGTSEPATASPDAADEASCTTAVFNPLAAEGNIQRHCGGILELLHAGIAAVREACDVAGMSHEYLEVVDMLEKDVEQELCCLDPSLQPSHDNVNCSTISTAV